MHKETRVVEGSKDTDDTAEEIQIWQTHPLKNQIKIEISRLRSELQTIYENIE